jgi:hypothetical protein
MRKIKQVYISYRVDILLPTQGYAEYTSRRGVALAMAESLAAHLKRNQTGGRVVEIPSGLVLDEWPPTGTPQAINATRDRVQELREQFPGWKSA